MRFRSKDAWFKTGVEERGLSSTTISVYEVVRRPGDNGVLPSAAEVVHAAAEWASLCLSSPPTFFWRIRFTRMPERLKNVTV